MYTQEQRKIAIETFIRFDCSAADTIAELGYPNRHTLHNWWKEYQHSAKKFLEKKHRKSKFSDKQKKVAVDYYLMHGKSLARTIRAIGYPSRELLGNWIDELAPGRRKCYAPNPKKASATIETKIQAVAQLEARSCSAAQVAEKYGVSRPTPYVWRQELLEYSENHIDAKGESVSEIYDSLPDDIDKLKDMESDLKAQVRKLQLEIEVRQATLDILKKDQGTDPNRLTNTEKAMIIVSIRPKWKLVDLLKVMNIAKSSYEYAVASLSKPEDERRMHIRKTIIKSFENSGGTYGYRRISAQTGIGEWTVRSIMNEEKLVARTAKKKRRYSSYQGEISKAPRNLLYDKKGKHHFRADAPNKLWITDVTEFRIPAGKLYLSPVIDCFDGMPISWSISASPNAEMANSSLEVACAQLKEGEHPKTHSDRGCHYRWPGWIKICNKYGLIRSMSRKGYSPDNARAEGFFGRLKIEFFYQRNWNGVTLDELANMLDAYLRWYRDVRLKSDLGYKSPMQYRRNLGLIA